MQFPFIRCYNPQFPIPSNSFFILAKGERAGMPSFKPWVNSFTVSCQHEGLHDFYFWLCYGLANAGMFKARLRGSVIPFITIPDVHDVLRGVAPHIYENWKRYKEILSMLERLEQHKSNLAQQIIATKDLQRVLLQKYFINTKK